MDSKIYIYLAIGIAYYIFKFYKKSKEKTSNESSSAVEQISMKQKTKFYKENVKETEKEGKEIENKSTYEIASTKAQVESVNKSSNINKNKNSLQLTEKLKSLPELKRAFIYSEIFKTKF